MLAEHISRTEQEPTQTLGPKEGQDVAKIT
jgi:hypothetical protein